MEKAKRLMEASWWERLTEGEAGWFWWADPAQYISNPIFCWRAGRAPPLHSALSAPNPAAAAATHASTGDSWTLPGQSGSGSWCAQAFVCALRESVSQSCVSSGGSVVGLTATSSKRAYATLGAPRAPLLWQPTANSYLLRRHSDTVLARSLWGLWVLVCTGFVWALQASLVGMGFDSKHHFVPPTILLGLLLCPLSCGIFFLVGSSVLLSTVVKQRVVILEFLQGKMSAHPSTMPFLSLKKKHKGKLYGKKRTYLNHKGKVNPSGLKEISPEYSLERLTLKLKLQYFGHLMWRTDSLEKTLMLGKIKGRRKRGWQRMRW